MNRGRGGGGEGKRIGGGRGSYKTKEKKISRRGKEYQNGDRRWKGRRRGIVKDGRMDETKKRRERRERRNCNGYRMHYWKKKS